VALGATKLAGTLAVGRQRRRVPIREIRKRLANAQLRRLDTCCSGVDKCNSPSQEHDREEQFNNKRVKECGQMDRATVSEKEPREAMATQAHQCWDKQELQHETKDLNQEIENRMGEGCERRIHTSITASGYSVGVRRVFARSDVSVRPVNALTRYPSNKCS
jgi:hypothetical protein